MAGKSPRGRSKPENPRKYKKKTSPLVIEKVEYVDYKDVDLLSRFMSDRAKIRNMRVSGNNRQQQLEIARAIKVAREMALLPYAKRVASASRQRPPRDGDRRGPRDGDLVEADSPELATETLDLEPGDDYVAELDVEVDGDDGGED